MDALAAEITRHTEWDERPELLTMYYQGGRGHLGQIPVPDYVWASGPPALVLESLAEASASRAELLQMAAPGELHGIGFFTEIWMATARAGSEADADLRRRVKAAGGRVSKLPEQERVEARAIWAVDRAGITYSVMQVRGEDEVQRAVSYPKAGQPALEKTSGTVPDALDKLVTAFLGVPLPARERV
jgi:hypothetical protein